MEDTLAYNVYLDKIRTRIQNAVDGANKKRNDRRMRNLKNKANGGFGDIQPGDVQAGQIGSPVRPERVE